MPGKLIVFITILVIIVTFIGFNYSNSSNITFWPEKVVYEEVPIFVSFFIMYLIGVISVIPFIVGWRMKNRQNKGSENSEAEIDSPAKKRKTRILGRKKNVSSDPVENITTSDQAESSGVDDKKTPGEIPGEGTGGE